MACDLIMGRTHVVDTLAALVLDFAGTTTTVREIVDGVVAETRFPRDDVPKAVEATVTELRALGLLDRPDVVVETPRGPGSPCVFTRPYSSNVFSFLDRKVVVRSNDGLILRGIDEILGVSTAEDCPVAFFDVDVAPDWRVTSNVANKSVFKYRLQLFEQRPTVINDYAARSVTMPVLHAGAVRTPSGEVMLIPGHMNDGKSTLVLVLFKAGCDYLGDESACRRPRSLRAEAYPKPLTLENRSCRYLGLTDVDASVGSFSLGATQERRVISRPFRHDLPRDSRWTACRTSSVLNRLAYERSSACRSEWSSSR